MGRRNGFHGGAKAMRTANNSVKRIEKISEILAERVVNDESILKFTLDGAEVDFTSELKWLLPSVTNRNRSGEWVDPDLITCEKLESNLGTALQGIQEVLKMYAGIALGDFSRAKFLSSPAWNFIDLCIESNGGKQEILKRSFRKVLLDFPNFCKDAFLFLLPENFSALMLIFFMIRAGLGQLIKEFSIEILSDFGEFNQEASFEDVAKYFEKYLLDTELLKEYILSHFAYTEDKKYARKFYRDLEKHIESRPEVVAKVDGIWDSESGEKLNEVFPERLKLPYICGYMVVSALSHSDGDESKASARFCMMRAKWAFNIRLSDSDYALIADRTGVSVGLVTSLAFSRIPEYRKKINSLQDQLEKEQAVSTERQTQYKKQRSTIKELTKKVDELQRMLGKRDSSIQKQQRMIEELRETGCIDTKPIKAEMDKLRSEIRSLKDTGINSERANRKLKKENSEFREEVRRLKAQNKEIEDKLGETREALAESSQKEGLSSIETQVFANAVKGKKVVIVGGDQLHANMQSLGLDKFKYIKVGYRNIPDQDLANSDLIVIITSFVGHADINKPSEISRNYNIPILYYNNRNVPGLVQSIFNELYKQ